MPGVPYERGATDTDRSKACIWLKQACTAWMLVGSGTPRRCCARFFPEDIARPFHVLLARNTRRDTRRTPRKFPYRSCCTRNRSRCRSFCLFGSRYLRSVYRPACSHNFWEPLRLCNKVPQHRPRSLLQINSEFWFSRKTSSLPFLRILKHSALLNRSKRLDLTKRDLRCIM